MDALNMNPMDSSHLKMLQRNKGMTSVEPNSLISLHRLQKIIPYLRKIVIFKKSLGEIET